LLLDWLADKHQLPDAAAAAERIERAVDNAYADGIKPMEFGGRDGTAEIAHAIIAGL
jgi:3-isopropylmalate dehydrogenase